jgi:hypothetical protein
VKIESTENALRTLALKWRKFIKDISKKDIRKENLRRIHFLMGEF